MAASTSSNTRFQVSAEGMREMNEGRPAWHLVKELVQNVWDEAPVATMCAIRIERVSNRSVRLEVEDDGPGFANIEDSYTLLRPTGKRLDPSKRGRFNLGEKEFVSVAREASIETAGFTVSFPRSGGREVKRNKRTEGTLITAVMPWTNEDVADLKEMLTRFRPTDCGLTVNGEEIPRIPSLREFKATLPSVLQSGPGEPLRRTRRMGDVNVLPLSGMERGWLYEMGIPVQELEMPFGVDVLQKMPLAPQRDGVSDGYLKVLSAHLLNHAHDLLSEEDARESWTSVGISHDLVSKEAVQSIVQKRYGNRAVLWSSDRKANQDALDQGFTLIPRGSMTSEERDKAVVLGGLQTARETHGHGTAEAWSVEPSENQRKFADLAKRLARTAGLRLTVDFIESPDASVVAMCTPGTDTPRMTVNVSKHSDAWYAMEGVSQVELILHELGHAANRSVLPHSEGWGDSVARIAARIVLARGLS